MPGKAGRHQNVQLAPAQATSVKELIGGDCLYGARQKARAGVIEMVSSGGILVEVVRSDHIKPRLLNQ